MSNEKLYPPKCVKCGCFVSEKELDTGKAKGNFIPDSHYSNESIWFEHTYDCKEIIKKYEQATNTSTIRRISHENSSKLY